MQIKNFFKDYHYVAIVETGVILIFTVLPTIAGLLAGAINSDLENYSKFYKSGEFLLYAVSLLSGAFLVYNKFRVKASDWKRLLSMIIMVCLLLLSLLYALIIVSPKPNVILIRNISSCFFFVSIFLFYHSQVLSNKHSPDISAQRDDEQQVIEDAIN